MVNWITENAGYTHSSDRRIWVLSVWAIARSKFFDLFVREVQANVCIKHVALADWQYLRSVLGVDEEISQIMKLNTFRLHDLNGKADRCTKLEVECLANNAGGWIGSAVCAQAKPNFASSHRLRHQIELRQFSLRVGEFVSGFGRLDSRGQVSLKISLQFCCKI